MTAEALQLESALLGRPTLCVLDDGRQVVGNLGAIDYACNILLVRVVMKRAHKSSVDSEERVLTRSMQSFIVPAKHLIGFYQRETMEYEYPARHTN